jgi:pimeloyl-ACP methyl ester carboxylesterase
VLQILLWLIVAFALLFVLGAIYQIVGARLDRRRFPAPGRLIQAGSHKLHLFELGSGAPAVILESGISASHLNWRTVQIRLASFAKVCSYDRAGLGWSELCPESCTPSSLAAQLHEMLCAASVDPPYILVGHSFGGLIVRSFAAQYPQETVGVVLVDPLDPSRTESHSRAAARGRLDSE